MINIKFKKKLLLNYLNYTIKYEANNLIKKTK